MTKRDIVNLAFAQIGETPVNGSPLARDHAAYADLVYNSVLEDVQSCTTWRELTKTALVSPTGHDSARGNEYNKPKDCLRIQRVNDGRYGDDFQEEGGFIYIKNTSGNVEITYTRKSDVPDEWSSELRQAIVALLAARVCTAIRKNITEGQQLEDQFWRVTRPRLIARHLNRAQPRRDRREETL